MHIKNIQLSNHAYKRYKERINPDTSRAQIKRNFNGGVPVTQRVQNYLAACPDMSGNYYKMNLDIKGRPVFIALKSEKKVKIITVIPFGDLKNKIKTKRKG